MIASLTSVLNGNNECKRQGIQKYTTVRQFSTKTIKVMMTTRLTLYKKAKQKEKMRKRCEYDK